MHDMMPALIFAIHTVVNPCALCRATRSTTKKERKAEEAIAKMQRELGREQVLGRLVDLCEPRSKGALRNRYLHHATCYRYAASCFSVFDRGQIAFISWYTCKI